MAAMAIFSGICLIGIGFFGVFLAALRRERKHANNCLLLRHETETISRDVEATPARVTSLRLS